MLLVNWFVDAARVLFAQQTVVLRVVDQLDEEDANERVANLEPRATHTKHAENGAHHGEV